MTRRTNMPGAMGVLGFVCVQVCTHAGHFLWALKSTGGPAGQIGDKLARRTCSMGPGAVQASCKGLISFCITHQSSLHRKHVQGPKRQRELQTKGAVHLLEKSQANLDHQLN